MRSGEQRDLESQEGPHISFQPELTFGAGCRDVLKNTKDQELHVSLTVPVIPYTGSQHSSVKMALKEGERAETKTQFFSNFRPFAFSGWSCQSLVSLTTRILFSILLIVSTPLCPSFRQ